MLQLKTWSCHLKTCGRFSDKHVTDCKTNEEVITSCMDSTTETWIILTGLEELTFKNISLPYYTVGQTGPAICIKTFAISEGITGRRYCCRRSCVGEALHCIYCKEVMRKSLHLKRRVNVLRYHFLCWTGWALFLAPFSAATPLTSI